MMRESKKSVDCRGTWIVPRNSVYRGKQSPLLRTVILLVLIGVSGLFSSPSAQAEVITVTITGFGSGNLTSDPSGQGNLTVTDIVNTPFVWSLTYDTAVKSFPVVDQDQPDLTQPVFLNPVSVIALQGYPAPIYVTQEQGVWIYSTDHLYMAPISMLNGVPAPNNTNILTIEGGTAWDGFSQPYQTGNITVADFAQFANISTDQGALTFSSGTVASVSANSPYLAWAGGITWNGGDSLPGADPDHDGVVNFMEYALGGNPVSALSAPRPLPQVSADNMLEITFLRAGTGLTYTVQASSDLINWSEILYTPVAVGGTQVVSDTANLADNPRRFLRLRVSAQ